MHCFSTTMPNCVDVQKVRRRHITRVVKTSEVDTQPVDSDGSGKEDEADAAADAPAFDGAPSDNMTSISQKDSFEKKLCAR